MGTTKDDLKLRQQDYFVAHWVNNELEMEPFCSCGNPLAEDFFCNNCQRQCECTFVLATDEQTLAVVEKFIHGNPRFRNFKSALLDQ